MQKQSGSRKHLTMRQRNYIEVSILQGRSIMQMARYLRFSRQSIYHELHGNAYIKRTTKHLGMADAEPICVRLTKYPFVCNVCPYKQTCRRVKRYYHADVAHSLAKHRLVDRRKGTRLSKGQLLAIDETLTPLIKKGQSLHHIYKTNPGTFPVCERTLRNLINRQVLTVRNIDLPYTVRFKVKKVYKPPQPLQTRMPEVLLGRTYEDFSDTITFGDHYVQLDSVIGKQTDTTAILTIFFPTLSFMFGFLCRPRGWLSVNNHLLQLRTKLGPALWHKAFPVLLCDRGSEFDRLYLLEHDLIAGNTTQLSKVFYADAYNASQRAAIESNHRLIRRIIPKGRSINDLHQWDLDLIFSHINGLVRKQQANKTGYELAKASFGEAFLQAINISYIAPHDVNLKPDLLTK